MRTYQTLQGGWHYAQGHWIACDALTNDKAKAHFEEWKPTLMWAEENQLCGFSGSSMNPGYNGIHHSSGEGGAFIYMDEANNYFGVYVQYWDVWLMLFMGIQALMAMSCCCCCVSCGIATQVNYKKMQDNTLKE